MNEQRVLVTGGCGFVGIHVLQSLAQRGYKQVTVIDKLLHGTPEIVSAAEQIAQVLQMDITSQEAFDLVAGGGFDIVIHLAALHYIPYCDAHPMETCRTNIEGTQNLLTASASAGVKRFFLASTAAVYQPSDRPHSESDPVRPVDIYGVSKLANEEQVTLAARSSDCKFTIGRFFNAVGAFETNPHLVPEIIRRLRTSDAIEIGSVTPRRDYIHAMDVAEAVLAMTFAAEKSIDVCNIGSGASYSVKDIVDLIAEIKDVSITLIPTEKYMRKVDRPLLQSDNRRIAAEYHWRPKRTLAKALKDAIEFDAGIAAAQIPAKAVGGGA